MGTLSITELRAVLDYDPATGIFTWKARPSEKSPVKIGARAGTLDPNGHRYITIAGTSYLEQRLAWAFVYKRWPAKRLRFLNGDRTDSRIENLAEPAVTNWRSKEGRSKYGKLHRERNPDYYRDFDLRRSFGITLDEYRKLLAAQNGVCAICRQPERGKRNGKLKLLAVDHCHRTNKIRGLLCSNCNPLLGYAQEEPARLAAAIEYLKRHNGA